MSKNFSLPPLHLTVTLGVLLTSSALSSAAFAQDELDEIIVTGSPLSRTVSDTITGVSVLTGEELEDRLAGTIGETLKLEPGVSSTFFGAGASRPIIRGQDGDRVRVLDNGIGTFDVSSFSPDHVVATEAAQAERIEVVRGASVLRFGSSGAGGVVNVIDGRIPETIPEDGLDGAVRVGGSTVDDGFNVAGSVDVKVYDNIVFHFDGTYRDTDDFNIPGFSVSDVAIEAAAAEAIAAGEEPEEVEGAEGTQPNSATEVSAFAGGVSYIGDNGFFGVSIRQFDAEYGITEGEGEGEEEEEEGGEEGEEEGEEAPFVDAEQLRVDIRGRVELDSFIESVDLFAGYADFEQLEFEAPGEAGTLFANEGWEARLEAVQAESNGWKAAYGAQVRIRDFEAISFEDDSSFVPPSTTRQLGIYTFQEVDYGQVHFELGARYENVDIENDETGFDTNFNALSISGGADYHFTDQIRFGVNGFRTERAPSAEELFTNGVHLSTQQFEIGDATLGEETALGAEVSLRYKGESNYFTLNGFYTSYDDYIFGVQTGEFEDGLPVFQFLADDADFRGFEAQAGQTFGEYYGFEFSGDALVEFVRADTDSGDLPRIPPLAGVAGLNLDNETWGLRAELDWAASQNRIAEVELPTDGFVLVNLFATYRFDLAAQDFTFKVSANNLLDDEARQHTSFLKDVLPLPGRNVKLSLGVKF